MRESDGPVSYFITVFDAAEKGRVKNGASFYV